MPARNVRRKPPKADAIARPATTEAPAVREESAERYRRLPTGTHGLDPEVVQRDQRERLQHGDGRADRRAGLPGRAGRSIVTKLAHVSRPTFYSLYADKEDLFLSAYDEISGRSRATRSMAAYEAEGSDGRASEGGDARVRRAGRGRARGDVAVRARRLRRGQRRRCERRNRTLEATGGAASARSRGSPSIGRAQGGPHGEDRCSAASAR